MQLAEIKHLLEQSPESSRYQLSRRLATLWNWRTASGQLKDMAARTLLLKLQEQGWIKLPERRWESPTRSGRAPSPMRARRSWTKLGARALFPVYYPFGLKS